jgi:hypothetical protein
MAAFSKRMHQAIAAYITGTQMPTPPVSLLVALCAGDPGEDASTLVEPTGGYARQPATFSAAPADAGGTKLTSTVDLVFGAVTGANWPTVTHGALFDQAGNMISKGPLGINRAAPVGDTISFGAGVIQFVVK